MEKENKQEVNIQHGSTKLMLSEVIGKLFKLLSLMFCPLGFHNYEYTKERLLGISLFGHSYDLHDVRNCKKCGKKQVETTKDNWENLN